MMSASEGRTVIAFGVSYFSLRAFLTALVGAAAAAFLVFGLTRGAVAPQSLMNVAFGWSGMHGLVLNDLGRSVRGRDSSAYGP